MGEIRVLKVQNYHGVVPLEFLARNKYDIAILRDDDKDLLVVLNRKAYTLFRKLILGSVIDYGENGVGCILSKDVFERKLKARETVGDLINREEIESFPSSVG